MLELLSNVLSNRQASTDSQSERERAELYQCRTCDTVYIAPEKQTCSQCRTAVEQVPATLPAE